MNIDIHFVIHRNRFETQELCGASIMKNIHVFSNIDISSDIRFNTKKIFNDDSDVTFYKCTFSYIRPFKFFRVKKLTFRNCNFTQMNSFHSMFYNNKWLKDVKFISCKIETIKDMSLMFSKCKSLESVQFVDSKTTSLRLIDDMFRECCALEDIEGLTELNVSNVVSMNSSKTSVQSTTVLGMATRAFSNSSKSG